MLDPDRVPEVGLAAAIVRPPTARTAHAMREQLYRAAGASPPAATTPAEALSEDPARRMAERLKQLPAHRPPVQRLSR